jgi:hypothetical protein
MRFLSIKKEKERGQHGCKTGHIINQQRKYFSDYQKMVIF